jgi:hypothetical protein
MYHGRSFIGETRRCRVPRSACCSIDSSTAHTPARCRCCSTCSERPTSFGRCPTAIEPRLRGRPAATSTCQWRCSTTVRSSSNRETSASACSLTRTVRASCPHPCKARSGRTPTSQTARSRTSCSGSRHPRFGPALIERARRLLAPTLATLASQPFLFGESPTLADAALYGQCAMLEAAHAELPSVVSTALAPFMRRVEARARIPR